MPERTSNDQRSNVKNPNNSDYEKDRANQESQKEENQQAEEKPKKSLTDFFADMEGNTGIYTEGDFD